MKAVQVALTVALGAAFASAQDLSSLPTCATECATSSMAASDCSSSDIECICKSDAFVKKIGECVVDSCPADDQEATISFASSLCEAAGVTLPSGLISSITASATASSASASSTGSSNGTESNATSPTSSSPSSTESAESAANALTFSILSLGAAVGSFFLL